MSQWERIVWIDSQIRQGKYPNADKVAEVFEVSRRQAFLDRAFMEERLGAPIAYSRQHRGWYYTDDAYSLPAILLRKNELLSLFLVKELASKYLGPEFAEQIASALHRIEGYLPDSASMDVDGLINAVVFAGAQGGNVDLELLTSLQRAVARRRKVRIVYYTAGTGQTNERVVDPYRILNIRGEWYMIAYCHLRKDFRDFRLNRIKDWELLRETFTPDPNFDVNQYIDFGFQAEHGDEPMDVVVRFDAFRARWVRDRVYHHTQQLEELPDGGVLLRMRTAAFHSVVKWVLGFGPHAEVLEPKELREAVAQAAIQTAKLYTGSGTGCESSSGSV